MAKQIIVTQNNYGILLETQFIDDAKNPIDLTGYSVTVEFEYLEKCFDVLDATIINAEEGRVGIILEQEHTAEIGLYKTQWSVVDDDENVTAQEDIYYFVKQEVGVEEDNIISSELDIEGIIDKFKEVDEAFLEYGKKIINIAEEVEEAREINLNLKERLDKVDLQLDTMVHKNSNGLLIDISEKIKGASIYLPVTDVSNEEQFINILNKCKVSNCNTITICPIMWMTSNTANTFDGYKSPLNEATIIARCKKAKELGFKVALKPHVGGDGISSHGDIKPSNVSIWLDNYSALFTSLVTSCKDYIDIVCVNNELNGQTNQLRDKWINLIKSLQNIKNSLLIGSACHFYELRTNVFLDQLDFLGCNMYVPVEGDLSTPIEKQRASLFTISNAINELLAKADELNKPIIITEVGILPFEMCLSNPEKWGFAETPIIAEDAQVRYYNLALKEYLYGNNILGTFIWNACDGYTFIDRKAQETVKYLYGGGNNV